MDTLTNLKKDLTIFKKIVFSFSILAIVCGFWHKDNLSNLAAVAIFTGYFIVIGALGWRDTARAIKRYETDLKNNYDRKTKCDLI
jgi:hypothetical protein